MNKEMQHWLDRNRPPRVQITYDVEKLGATVKEEIPFIVGIIGDFVGSTQQKAAIAERTFVEIDRDSFEQVMQRLGPTLTLTPPKPQLLVKRTPDGNTYAPDPDATKVFPVVGLAFQKLVDFGPRAIIDQVPYLQGLMQTRQDLSDLVAKLGTAPSLDADLKTAAAASALTAAKDALTAADPGLTTPATGAKALYDAAAGDVLKLETADPNKTTVTNAQAAVTTAVGDANGGYTKAFTAATGANPTAADLQAAADALQQVMTALQDGISVLKGITKSYDATAGTDDQKAAITAVQAASDAVDAFVPAAWQGSLCLNSAAVVNPAAPAA